MDITFYQSYMNKTQIFKIKDLDDVPSDQFCLECVSKDFKIDGIREIAFNGNAYNLSIYVLIHVEDIFNIHEDMMKSMK